MSPAARARSEAMANEMEKEFGLDELREARHLTQETLAKALNISQASVSKMERRADMYISSLQGIIRAMGGKMEIRVTFPDGNVAIINQFRDLDENETNAGHSNR